MKFLFAYAMCVVWDMGMTRFWRPDWLVFVAIDVAICVVIGLCVASKPARVGGLGGLRALRPGRNVPV